MMARILIIEDHDENLYLMGYLLRAVGHEVLEATDGPRGVAAARSQAPDLVLLDIGLPGMDGHAVARALRADPATRALPVVAVTSHAMPGDREAALSAGCTGYIEKPIDPDTFVSQVQEHIGGNACPQR